jgi:hypothetical protein
MMIYPIDDIPYFAKLEIIFYACTCALICTCDQSENCLILIGLILYLYTFETRNFWFRLDWKKAGKSINMCSYYIKMVKRRMDHILRTFFILSTNSLCFLALGGLGAENRTPLSSKQSNFSTWKSWQKFEDLNNTINFKPTHPQPKKSMAESFVF